MKKIFCAIMITLLMLTFSVTAFATESTKNVPETEFATEVQTEVVETEIQTEANKETSAEISKEDFEDIIGIIEDSDNRSDVIVAIVEKFGCSQDEAEDILDTFLALGDKYLGSNEVWVGFKKDIQEDTQFWTMVIMCAVAVLFIIGGIFVLLGKTNPTMRRAMFGMNEALSIGKKQYEENSQTLANMLKTVEESKKKEELYEEEIQKKEDAILALEEKIELLEEHNEKERKNMLIAETYNLRMLKLICDRTAMPITDKSMIDLWYAKGIDSIKDELNEEDIKKINSMFEMLSGIGGIDEEQ